MDTVIDTRTLRLVRVFNAPPGLGTHAGWEDKLDGRLAQALMSVQTVKAVEVGLGFEAARRMSPPELVGRVDLDVGFARRIRLHVDGAGHDQLVDRLQTPAILYQFLGEIIE